jgi:hypothetical protein
LGSNGRFTNSGDAGRTPVVAFRRCSMAEVIDEAVTGNLAVDVTSAVRAVMRPGWPNEGWAREPRQRFSAARMVSDYYPAGVRRIAEGMTTLGRRAAKAGPMGRRAKISGGRCGAGV